ncbi:glycosyl hydrolase [Streptomyces sp. TSRI0445]|uniref:Glycosyl hydrolase n=1 Tax=Streptomyces globisporus TaxID=1908 RepID=A0ABM9H2Q4_STRGL|nr:MULTISPECIES: RICIN domain-containing protein [Streptomyces]OKI67184.1 glycosyl hydrolase [Streptomyces sp. TSRI0445]RDL05047.1 glucosylceramidase [Streptomyces sp. HB202]UIZ10993.1 RICIN domain-containing protein [Streptomyces sp. R527F]CAH9417879.1 putative glycosyl hydrolase [Streptomyces globisporus]
MPSSTPLRFRARAAGAALVVTVAALGVDGAVGTARAADPVAQVWVTTPDGSKKLTPEGNVPFTGSPQAIDIRIDANNKGQKFTGAGASVTGASAHLLQGLPQAQRTSVLKSLFSTEGDGIGLNYLRQPLGSTDFDANTNPYTYEDTRGAFSIDRDRSQIIPVLKQATAVNPAIRFMGSPWSPPAWMKTNNSLNGGSLRTEHYQTYADYLVKAIRAYGQEGITLTDLTAQNEPEFATSYPSMSMTSAQQADFLRVLDRTLTAANLPTNILAYDHNWDHPNYPLDVFARTAGIQRIIGAAFHCYGGAPAAQKQIADAGKRVFFTECSGTDSATPATTFGDTLKWHAENLVVQNMRNGGETVINWNLALDRNGGPHQGHCTNRCNGIVEIDGGQVTRNAEFYVLGHVSKFIKAGAVRISSTSQGAGGVQNVAFQNSDGSRAAVVVNTAAGSQRFSLTDNGRSLAYTLPAGAVATFTWDGSGGTTEPPVSIDPAAWYQVRNANSGACLDAADWGTADGTALQQWACGTGANQGWQFRPTDTGHYQVVNRHNAKTWDVDGGPGATADGTRVHLWSYQGGVNQQWRPEALAGAGQYRFVARHSGKCLAVDNSSTANGARLSQQPCSGSPAQVFSLTR